MLRLLQNIFKLNTPAIPRKYKTIFLAPEQCSTKRVLEYRFRKYCTEFGVESDVFCRIDKIIRIAILLNRKFLVIMRFFRLSRTSFLCVLLDELHFLFLVIFCASNILRRRAVSLFFRVLSNPKVTVTVLRLMVLEIIQVVLL